MTATPARTPAPSRPAIRALTRLGTRLGAAVLATLLVVGAAPAATAATQTPTPSPTPSTVTPGEVELTLAPVGNGVVRAGEALSVSVRIDNGTSTPTDSVTVTLALGDAALADRTALSQWLDGTTTATTGLRSIGTVDVPSVEAASNQTRDITVAATDPALATRAPGIYPLVASYTGTAVGTGGTISSTSVMVVPDAAATPTEVGIVVPITGPPIGTGLLTAAQLSALTAPTGSLTNQLEAVAGTTAILAVDPAIVAAIRVLGSAAPASAAAWLARLEALPNSRFALQFGDADVAAQLQAGLSAPEQPTSLRAYMSASNFAAAADGAATPTPTPTSDSGDNAYPPLDELLDIGGGRSGLYWPAGGTAGADVLDTLAGGDPAALTLIPSATLTAGAAGATVPSHVTVGTAGVLAYDSDVSSALRKASLIDTSVLRGAPLTAATAYLVFAAAESAGRPLLVTVDRAAARSEVALSATISAALQAPGVTAVGLDPLVRAEPQATETVESSPGTTGADASTALFADEARIAGFATIVDDPSLLTGPQRAETLQLLGNSWRTVPDEWQSALAAHGAATLATLDAVGILAPTTAQLLSATTPQYLWVRNDLPYPVNVVLTASPDDVRLDVQRETTITGATARSNTRVEVPVTARVGSGEVSVDLQLHSTIGEPIGAPQHMDVTVRADWEGIGLTALLVIVGALVLFGFIRTVQRRRRTRREAVASADVAGPADPADPAGPAGPPVEPRGTS